MNKEENFWLNQLCKNEGLSKADALRTLIKMGYDMSKNGVFNVYPKNSILLGIFNGYPKNTYKIMENWIKQGIYSLFWG